MTTILLMACIGMITGLFILLGITPAAFSDAVFKRVTGKPGSIKSEINELTERKKKSVLRREIAEVQEILKVTGREHQFPLIALASLGLFAAGAAFAVMIGNYFLVPVMAVGFMFLPFWYVRLTQTHFKKAIAAELETALSIITTAYLRNEDILTATEENLDYLNPPVQPVLEAFVNRIKYIDADIPSALTSLKSRIDNDVFREWCDALISCQFDRTLKSTLTPIVAKLSDMRVVNGELENMVFEPRKEFIIMQLLVILNVPLLYFLNKEWYHTLMHTTLGQFILAVSGAAIFISTAFVIKLTKPIEYLR